MGLSHSEEVVEDGISDHAFLLQEKVMQQMWLNMEDPHTGKVVHNPMMASQRNQFRTFSDPWRYVDVECLCLGSVSVSEVTYVTMDSLVLHMLSRNKIHKLKAIYLSSLIIQGEFLHKVCMAGVAPQLKELVLQNCVNLKEEFLMELAASGCGPHLQVFIWSSVFTPHNAERFSHHVIERFVEAGMGRCLTKFLAPTPALGWWPFWFEKS